MMMKIFQMYIMYRCRTQITWKTIRKIVFSRSGVTK